MEDGADFLFTDFNPAAERIDRISREEVIGRRVTEVFPGVKGWGLLAVLERVWHTGEAEHHETSPYRDERIADWRVNRVHRLPSGEVVARTSLRPAARCSSI